MMTVKEALLGKCITSVEISDSRDIITFITTEGAVKLYAEGDCCSTTWIESLDDEQALFGTVQDVENLPMLDLGSIPTHHHQNVDVISYYGLKITTEKGRCVIDYRNDSNGYYGGALVTEQELRGWTWR